MGLTGDRSSGLQGNDQRVDHVYRSYIGKDYPQPVKLPEIKQWVSNWTAEFGSPPNEVFLSQKNFNQRTMDRLHELGVTTIKPIGGVLMWEVHIGPVPIDPPI